MVKEALEAISEKIGDLSCNSRVDCCCPAFIFFVFKEVNCVQIFNGACEDWRPGTCPDDNKKR
ncbi:MAG TPA: hypothetical protein PL078_06005 [Bacillota bacterium]|nr:hypothetical protein [Peptococcaceae bacterium MAG4]NLW38116.1 hypothetical protein [Peptococcaceae bacterium]HPZ43542.1 hypothetical protein [Bacillota bacterium]HQD76063.1 hypothetical protein [Bacillota bacterium]HUM58752.1 hypothetical protein [Bacillota bacterium]